MVSEGVDIPRLRVGVFATTTTTELFFRQAVGRLVRWTRGIRGQKAFLFIPDEPRLRARAFSIAEQRRHSLRHDDREIVTRAEPVEEPVEPEQGSFFAPISAVPTGMSDGALNDLMSGMLDEDGSVEPAEDAALVVPLPPLPTGGRRRAAVVPEGRTLREHKQRLRDANSNRVRMIARATGMTHAAVNGELNRTTGLKRVSEATVEELERRLAKADQWWQQASAKTRTG
jgi:superfamily II DNA or RNA helicase